MTNYANECPGCGNLETLNHSKISWPYYCHSCNWGFGLRKEEENESPILDVHMTLAEAKRRAEREDQSDD